MVRNYKERALVWVTPATALANVKYGFNSGADAGDRAILGQTAVSSADLVGLVIGANNIKPGKATKNKATGSESSFYSIGAASGLKAAGWKLSRPKLRTYRKTSKSNLFFVTINGIKYGWRSAKTGLASSFTPGELGITAVDAGDIDIIYGCSFPKPPHASTIGVDGNTISTFIDPSKADSLPEGWGITNSGVVALLV
jgi:hypothetical protein